MGVDVNRNFNLSNATWASGDQEKSDLVEVSWVKGAAILLICLLHYCLDFTWVCLHLPEKLMELE